MKLRIYALSFLSVFFVSTAAGAETIEDMCLRVSDEWGSTGDVAGQCSCLADLAAEDQNFADELRELAAEYTSDADAYEAASDVGKAAFDQCAVET